MSRIVMFDENGLKRLRKAVPSENAILPYVADWLAHLSMFTDAQVYDILRFVLPVLDAFSDTTPDGRLESIAVIESRWITATSLSVFYDTETSDVVERLEEEPVTVICCNLTALKQKFLQNQGVPDAESDDDDYS